MYSLFLALSAFEQYNFFSHLGVSVLVRKPPADAYAAHAEASVCGVNVRDQGEDELLYEVDEADNKQDAVERVPLLEH